MMATHYVLDVPTVYSVHNVAKVPVEFLRGDVRLVLKSSIFIHGAIAQSLGSRADVG